MRNSDKKADLIMAISPEYVIILTISRNIVVVKLAACYFFVEHGLM